MAIAGLLPHLLRRTPGLPAAALLALTACGGGDGLTGPAPAPPPPPPPVAPTGSLLVTVETTGGMPDPDGYTFMLDDRPAGSLAANDSLLVSGLEPRTYIVNLTGLATNCVGTGIVARVQIEVTADDTTEARALLHCTAPLTEGIVFWDLRGTDDRALLLEGLGVSLLLDDARHPTLSPDRFWLAFARDGDIYVAPVDGGHFPRRVADGGASQPAWSPDGTRIAYSAPGVGGQPDVFVVSVDGSGAAINITESSARDLDPAWSPDGARLAFTSNRDGDSDVWAVRIDENGPTAMPLRLAGGNADGNTERQPAWSPDGKSIAYVSTRDNLAGDVFVKPLAAGTTNLTNTTKIDRHPVWSPDGSMLLFTSQRDGPDDSIYLMNADGSNQRRLTTAIGSSHLRPVWAGDRPPS